MKKLFSILAVLAVLLSAFGFLRTPNAFAAPVGVLEHPDSRGEGRPDNQPGDPYDLYSCNGKKEDQDNVLVENAWPPVEFFAGMDWKGKWGIDFQINPFWDEFSFILDSLGSKNPEPSITAHVTPAAATPGQSLKISNEATNFQSNQADIRSGWCVEDLQRQFCKIFGIVTSTSGRPEDCSGSISVQSLAAGGTIDNLARMNTGKSTGEGQMTCCGVLSRRPLKDDNSDGIDDDWVRRYFGINPITPFNPNEDSDGDGWKVSKIKKDPLVVPGVKKYVASEIAGSEPAVTDPGDLNQDPNDDKFQRAPIAHIDAATTTPGREIQIDVLANDTDINNNIDPFTLHISQSFEPGALASGDGNPEHGITQTGTNGIITYTPNVDYEGQDGFYYTICDSTDLCDYWTAVSITVSATPPAQSFLNPLKNSLEKFLSGLRSVFISEADAAPVPVKNCPVPADGVYVIGNNCFSNFEEFIWGTNPLDADTDDDGVPDEADIAGAGQMSIPFTWPLQLEIPYIQFRVQVAGISTKSSFFGGSSDLMKMDSEPIRVYRGQNEPLRVVLSADQSDVAISTTSQVNLLASVSSPSDLQEGFLDYRWQVSIDGNDPAEIADCPGGQGNNQCIVNIRPPSDTSLCRIDVSPPPMYCPGQHVEFIVTGTVKTGETILSGLPLVPQYGNSSTARVAIDISPEAGIITAEQNGSVLVSNPENPSVFLAANNVPVNFTIVSLSDPDSSKYYFEWLRDDIVDVAQSGIGKTTATYTFGVDESKATGTEILSVEKVQVRTVHLDREREYSRDMIRIQALPPTTAVVNPAAPVGPNQQAGVFQLAFGNRPTLEASLHYGSGPVIHRWILDGKKVFEGSQYRLAQLTPGSHTLLVETYRPSDPKTIISSDSHSISIADPVNAKERTQFALAKISASLPDFSRTALLIMVVFGGVFLTFHFLTRKHYSVEKKQAE